MKRPAKTGISSYFASPLRGLREFFGHRKEWNPVCLAPWVHSYVAPSGERSPCCFVAPFEQSKEIGFSDFWNGKEMRRLRLEMLEGDLPERCSACSTASQQPKERFHAAFAKLKPALKKSTTLTGKMRGLPISFDHRISHTCNFKCFMCDSGLSSSFAAEQTIFDGEYSLEEWQRGSGRGRIRNFHSTHSVPELLDAIENGTVKDIYWAGGEPVLNEFHWQAMRKIIERGLCDQVMVRYNTNLSRLEFKGSHLFRDILSHFPRYEVGASLDAVGQLGEYLRGGMDWPAWEKNLLEALPFVDQKQRVLLLASTVSVPSLLGARDLLVFAQEHGLPINAGLIDTPLPEPFPKIFSPFVLHQPLLKRLVAETLESCSPYRSERSESFFEQLDYLSTCETRGGNLSWQEKDSLKEQWISLSRKENARGQGTLREILAQKPYLHDWYREIFQWDGQ